MTELQEDTDLLSQKELEDGEIEDGELNEADCIETIDNEPEIICIDTHDDSDDLNINNKTNVKIKKHNLHKKSSLRKRHLNSEEKGDGILKKSKKYNDDGDGDRYSSPVNCSVNKIIIDCDDYQSGNVDNSCNYGNNDEAYDRGEKDQKWGNGESDEELSGSKNNRPNYLKENRNMSPVYECSNDNNNPVSEEPREVAKWNDYDSEEESKTTSEANQSSFNESNKVKYKNNNSWDSNKGKSDSFERNVCLDKDDKNESENQGESNDPDNLDVVRNSPVTGSGWGSYESPTGENQESKRNETKNDNDNFGKWGSYDSPDKTNDDNQKWGSKENENNSSSNKWGSYESPDKTNDDNQKWGWKGNENNNSNRWGSRESPDKSNDGNQKWGSRDNGRQNDDNDNSGKWGSRRNGRQNDNSFNNKWGSNDNSEKSDDNNQRWNNRDNRKDNENDSQRWGSRDGSRRNNFRRRGTRDGSRRNNSFRRWGDSRDGSNGNQKWGSNYNDNNDDKKWGSNYNDNNDDKKWGSSYNDSNNDDKKWGSSYNDSNNDDKKWGSNSPQRNDSNKRWNSNNASPQRSNDDNTKWGSSPTDTSQTINNDNPIPDSTEVPEKSAWGNYDSDEDTNQPTKTNYTTNETRETNVSNNKDDDSKSPEKSTWDSLESNNFSNNKSNNNDEGSSFGKWGSFESDEEDNSKRKEDTKVSNNIDGNSSGGGGNYNKRSWDEEVSGGTTYGEYKGHSNYGNSGSNRNDRNDKNDRNKRWSNRNDGEKPRNVCKYFSMGSCRHGDRCTFLHESPTKQQQQQQQSYSVNQEPKRKELCKFYEHQQCYKRANCSYMHEDFPCKLFHAGSKMCPSGDSCKYSHAPLNQETKSLLEKYLDEKVDGRTEKNDSDWNSINKKSAIDDDIDNDDGCVGFELPEGGFPDPALRFRYPSAPDMMRFPVRPWSSMMRFNDMAAMPVPHQMEMMHRQRLLCQYPLNVGRMLSRGFRGMVPPNMHEGFSNGMPYPMPPMMGGAGLQKMHPSNPGDLKDKINVSDPYIDNLAQLVVSKDLPNSPKRLVDMLDPTMQCEDIDDFMSDTEINSSKKNLSSPVMMKSPEIIPPGAYVPRTSMNMVQPNGPGSSFGAGAGGGTPGAGSEQAMLYGGGFPGHPNESAMMDLINFSAIHYYHNHPDPIGYDIPWKPVLLEVPIKIPYPLMDIETEELAHKYSDPRLKGHPSVLNANTANDESVTSMTASATTVTNNQNNNNQSSSSSSPNYLCSASSETFSGGSTSLMPLNDFLPKSDLLMANLGGIGAPGGPGGGIHIDSSMLFSPVVGGLELGGGIGGIVGSVAAGEEDIFNFQNKPKSVLGGGSVVMVTETADQQQNRFGSDRSYLQDPRFKRKKAVVATNPTNNIMIEFSDLE